MNATDTLFNLIKKYIKKTQSIVYSRVSGTAEAKEAAQLVACIVCHVSESSS